MSKKNKNLITSAENANKTEKVKDNSTFKKILKFTGFFLLTIVAVVVIGIFGTWITGRFNPKKIYIQSLSINNQKEFVTISNNDKSYKTTISFEPAAANQLVLTPKIITGSDLIESMPTVKAGEEFEIVFAKDENGITKGGEIEIKFLDSTQSAYTTLKVLIDVGLHSNYIDITTNGTAVEKGENNTLTTNVLTAVKEESANVIKIKALHDAMLNSYHGNWSESDNNSVANLNRLKKMILHYNQEDTSIRGFGANGSLVIEEVLGNEKYYAIKFLSPSTTIEPFKLDVYIYKTYYMETLFSEENVKDILDALDGKGVSSDDLNYVVINQFINEYVYNDSSVAVKNNFANFVNKDTNLIELGVKGEYEKPTQFRKALQDILNYVLIGKRIMITVDNIEVSEIMISKQDSTVQLGVLQNLSYGISEVHSNSENGHFGITLISQADNADSDVLFNNLKKLEVFLCERTSDTVAPTTVYDYFTIDAYTYKKIENNKNEYLELSKTYSNGEAQWNLKTLSPMPSYSEYYLVYRYRNNDLTSVVKGEGESETEFFLREDKWHTYSSSGYAVYYPSEIGTDGSTLFEQLNAELKDIYSVAPIKITYNGGTITYNTNANINNATETTVVLNDKVYKYTTETGMREVLGGQQGGVYYNYHDDNVDYRRVFTAGTTNKSNVILTSNNGQEMEYTMVKWFVPYTSNIVDYTEGMNPQNYKYYFMPVLETKYDNNKDEENQYYNPIPAKVRLKQVDSNSYFGSESTYFMEIGTDTFTLQALNAMAVDYKIPLYAFIIQTKINGEPYFNNSDINDPDIVVPADDIKFNTAKEIRYHYISATDTGASSGHTLRVENYVDTLKFFVSNNGSYYESSTDNSIVLQAGGAQGVNYVYLSNISIDETLTSDTTPIYDNDNNKILIDAIDNLRNKRIALYNYYSGFIDKDKPAYQVSIPGDSTYPDENSYEIKVEDFREDFNDNDFIKLKVTCNSVKQGVPTSENKFTYTYYISTLVLSGTVKPPVSTEGISRFFTDVSSVNFGVFVLSGAISEG